MKFKKSKWRISVYHLIPRNNGKSWWLMRMGEAEPIKTFNKKETGIDYIDKTLMKRLDAKVYINDLENHAKRYKKKEEK
ncbi:MAG: hypothetical protein MJ214_05080 [Bacilli bacterium]|nr:hypothetical protein [Bacilli bacterium]